MPDYQELQSEASNEPSKSQNVHDELHLTFGPLGESIIQSLPIGVVTFRPDLKIIDANPQAAGLIELHDTIDKSLAKGTNNPGASGFDWTGQLKSTVATGKTHRFDSVSYTSNGKTRLLRIVCSPLKKAETKRIVGGSVIIEEITEKVNIQRRLANVEKLLLSGNSPPKSPTS